MRVRAKAVTTLALTLLVALAAGCGSGDGQGAQPLPSTSATAPSTPTSPTSTTSPSTGQPPQPASTATTVPAEMRDEDKQTLLAVLGPAATTQLCEPGPGTRVECGRMFAAASRLVAQLQTSLKGMPKTKPYSNFAGQLSLFQTAYSTSKNLSCFGAKTPKNPDICQSITRLAALSYLNTSTALLY
ncbi:MAG: hypothetical protein QOH03_3589 [Kribbellaceae bacterium]|jgi:hypothetical protein|nr:hypothetical protein [Kribbellaceae bacterium]